MNVFYVQVFQGGKLFSSFSRGVTIQFVQIFQGGGEGGATIYNNI